MLLRVPAQDDGPLAWVIADESGALLAAPADGGDVDLATMAATRRTALLVPAADVAHFDVQLPAGNDARLLQLVPFALEDQVSEDLDALHFAIGSRNAGTGLVPVAVASRERMARWLARAEALQLKPAAVYAENELAPVLPGHVTLVLDGDQLLLRTESGAPLVMPAADPALALEMLLGADVDLATIHLSVHADPAEWPMHAAAIEALRDRMASFNVQLEAGGVLSLYARSLGTVRPINLLQGSYRAETSSAGTWERWRGVAAAALALLVVHVAGTWWQLHQLQAESTALHKRIASIYSAAMPGQQPGTNPRRQFEQRLAEIANGGAQKSELLPMLAAIAAAHQNIPSSKLESVAFKPGAMELNVSAPDASALETFSQSLRAGGYSAEIVSGQAQQDHYTGQITMKAKGS
jgi:general secretion pathway protein L